MLTSQNSGIEAGEGSAWYALYTRHQHEKTVAEMLSLKGFEVFLPLYRAVHRWKDRSKILSLPLFPGYVFVRGGLDRRVQLVTTPGVYMILCRGIHVAFIPEEEILTIQKSLEGNYHVEPHPFLKCGDRVRVKRGALEGVEGILARKKNMCRLVLSVDMLAQSVGVEIDASDVEAVQGKAVLCAGSEQQAGDTENICKSGPCGEQRRYGARSKRGQVAGRESSLRAGPIAANKSLAVAAESI
jgi:transcription antitermination factor NusG